jgi:hypothetical protein
MKQRGVKPDLVACSLVLELLSEVRRVDDARNLMDQIIDNETEE